VAAEGDAADGVEGRSVVEHDGKSSHSENGIVDFDLADDLLAVKLAKGSKL
jgi:hypothetical protein